MQFAISKITIVIQSVNTGETMAWRVWHLINYSSVGATIALAFSLRVKRPSLYLKYISLTSNSAHANPEVNLIYPRLVPSQKAMLASVISYFYDNDLDNFPKLFHLS